MHYTTTGQIAVLECIKNYPLTGRTISERLNGSSGLNNWGYDRVHSILRRLENRGLVRRTYNGLGHSMWEVTSDGRREIYS